MLHECNPDCDIADLHILNINFF